MRQGFTFVRSCASIHTHTLVKIHPYVYQTGARVFTNIHIYAHTNTCACVCVLHLSTVLWNGYLFLIFTSCDP